MEFVLFSFFLRVGSIEKTPSLVSKHQEWWMLDQHGWFYFPTILYWIRLPRQRLGQTFHYPFGILQCRSTRWLKCHVHTLHCPAQLPMYPIHHNNNIWQYQRGKLYSIPLNHDEPTTTTTDFVLQYKNLPKLFFKVFKCNTERKTNLFGKTQLISHILTTLI